MHENELIESLRKGDSSAFQFVVNQYRPIVLRTVIGYLKNKEEAEDLAQEVFISVFENIAKFRGQSNLKTWIIRIAINKSINELRKQRWKQTFSKIENLVKVGIEIEDKSNPEKELHEKNLEDGFHKAMQKLPENQRTAFVLHKYDELSHQEISAIMNISVSAIESLIFRAKQNLQKFLVEFLKN